MSAIGQTGTVSATPSGPAEGQPPSTGQATPTTPEQGDQQPKPSGFWGRFPTVPEDQRAVLEPHLKTVQGYITRLEQNYMAPFKGYTPQQVQGLAQFAKAFDANPLQTFLTIAHQLQSNGVIHADLDLEILAAVASGREIPEEPMSNEEPVDDGATDPWEDAPPWALEIRAREQAREQEQQQQAQANRERQENAVLDSQVALIQTKLKESGFPENAISKKDLIARFIVHGGKTEAVLNDLQTLRTGLLQGAIPKPNNETVDLPNGVPGNGRTATQRAAKRDQSDPFKQASVAAEQMLRSSNRRNAQ